jgi:hypothetical protein
METKKQVRRSAPSKKHQKSRADEYLEEDEREVVAPDTRKLPVPPRNIPAVQDPRIQQVQDRPDFNNIYEPFVSGSGYSAY